MKETKRLVKALIALIASVVLCIGVCLAWFAANNDVSANDMQSGVHGNNIEDFNVTAYRLTETDTDGTYTVGAKYSTDNNTNSPIEMLPYGGAENTSSTAVLLEISYKCLEKTFKIQADCNKKYGFDMDKSTSATFVCYLSDAVEIFKGVSVKNGSESVAVGNATGATATVNGAGVTFTYEERTENAETGETETTTKKQDLLIADNIQSGEGAYYCIINYSEENITNLYRLAADNGGGISSAINFSFGTSGETDIVFYMSESV